jgi:hypothetical protein
VAAVVAVAVSRDEGSGGRERDTRLGSMVSEIDPASGTRLGALVGGVEPVLGEPAGRPLAHPGDFRETGLGASRVEAAKDYARARGGAVSFAVVDDRGVTWGLGEHDLFHSASVVKSMLLAAELRHLDQADLPLDPETRDTLTAMITISDNDAATAIYERVGDAGLYEVADAAGMEDFEVAASWGYAEISAADMALLFSDIDRVLPARFAGFAKNLLGSIVPEQSWGVPAVARGWSARFKGGWRGTETGQLVSQAAELRRGRRKLGIAILTDGQPSMGYGIGTVEGVAARLLGR